MKATKKMINELISLGIKPEEIATELNVPLSTIQKKIVAKAEPSKMDILRKKYYELYGTVDNDINNEPDPNIENRIQSLEEFIHETAEDKNLTKPALSFKQIINEFNVLLTANLSIPQYAKLITLSNGKELYSIAKKSNVESAPIYFKKLNSIQNTIINSLCQKYTTILEKINDVQSLDTLLKSLNTLDLSIDFRGQTFLNQLHSRIIALKSKERYQNRLNQAPEHINTICSKIISGRISKDEFDQIISQSNEANNQTIANQDSAKSLIRSLLLQKADKYPISTDRLDTVLLNLQNTVLGTDLIGKYKSIEVIIENLVAQKKYKESKGFLSAYSHFEGKSAEYDFYKQILALTDRITYKEIGDLLLDRIKNPVDSESDDIFLRSLEERIKSSGINPNKIPLGTDATGVKSITLLTVLPNAFEKSKESHIK